MRLRENLSTNDPRSLASTLPAPLPYFACRFPSSFPTPSVSIPITLPISTMKSVAFLRNTWKRWEHKTSDGRDNEDVATRASPSPTYPRTLPATGRSLTVTVKHLPLELTTADEVEGSWQRSDGYQPPSPIYDQFTQQRGERTHVHRDSSRFALDVSYSAHATFASRSAGNSPTPPTPTTPSSKNSPVIDSLRPTNAPIPWTSRRVSKQIPADARHQSHTPSSSSPVSPSLPSFQLLPPIDLNYGPGSRFESQLVETKTCKCAQSGFQSRHHIQCPKYTFSDAQKSKVALTRSDAVKSSQKTVHAVLDLSVESKPHSLYHLTSSSPHLPIKDRNLRHAPSKHSTSSTDGSEAEHFSLSLFPAPPPLIIRKKVPAPLVLRTTDSAYSQSSSVDSTPVGTPTTPRFHPISSPSQTSFASSSKKTLALRPSASFSPPPFSPPNSPLPSVPTSPQVSSRRPTDRHRSCLEHAVRPLRVAQSSANLRNALPFAATHRLTSSEPISDQSSLPIKRPQLRPARPRPETVRVKDLQAYRELTEQSMSMSMSSNNSENHVQWGYAL